MPRSIAVVSLMLLSCSCVAIAQENAVDDPLQAHRDRMDQRAAQAYERILAAQTTPPATTADEVIDRCITAMGGREALASLRTMKLTSSGHQVAGNFGGDRWLKAPNFVRQPRNSGRAIVTDGVSAWMTGEQGCQAAPPSRVVWQQVFSISRDLIDYDQKQVTYEFIGTEALEGTALYRLKKTLSTGKELFVCFDVATGLPVMEEEFGDDGRRTMLFFDYREVAGVLLPHLKVRIADILKTPHVSVMEWEANPELPDDFFCEE